MNKTTQPSYGWWLTQGATTSWEHWSERGSHNHPMFGGGIVWFYRVLAGMNVDESKPGYRHIVFKPQPAGDVTSVSYSNQTPYGQAGVDWKKKDGLFQLNVEVPLGSTATIYVPASGMNAVTEGGKKISNTSTLRFERMEKGYAVFSSGSGRYVFEAR